MTIILTAILVIAACFGAVLLVGAPYVPTLKKSRSAALDLLGLKTGQTLYELGSGDGAMLVEAAKRGLNVVGYELNPFLFAVSWLRVKRYKNAKVHLGDFWRADLSKADGVYVFLIDRFMARLDKKISREVKGKKIKLVSHAFAIPGKKPAKKTGAMLLYVYN